MNGKPHIREYEDLFDGKRPVAIICPGPSASESICYLPEDTFTIVVNRRPLELCPNPSMTFAMDGEQASWLYQSFKGDAVNVSFMEMYSEIVVDLNTIYNPGWSGIAAAGIGLYLGGNPVIVVGADLYRGHHPYFNEERGFYHGASLKPISYHLDMWEQLNFRYKHPERIRVINSPLNALFEEYKQ